MLDERKSKKQLLSEISDLRDIIANKTKSEKELKESETRFTLAVKGSNDAIWDWIDLKSDKYWWSDRLYEILGYKPGEVEVRISNWKRWMHPDDRARVINELKNHFEQKKPYRVEFRMKKKNGKYAWLFVRGESVRDKRGKPMRMAGSVTDITERKLTEEKLKESELRFRLVLENLPGGVFAHDLVGKIVMVNEAASKNTGWSREELLNMSVADIDPESITRNDHEKLWLLMKQGESMTLNATHIRKDKSKYIVELRLNAITFEDNPIILAVAYDITERKLAEEALTKSEEKFRKAFLTSPDSINISRLDDGTFIQINNGFTEITGYTEEMVIGKTSRQINIWENPKDREKLVKDLKLKGNVKNLEANFRMANGQIRNGLMSASIIELDGVPHIMSITRDITEWKLAEQALINSEQSYKELIDGMNETVWIIDFEGNLIDVNKRAIEVLGYTKEEIIEMGLTGIDSSLAKKDIKNLTMSMQSDKIQKFETTHKSKSGKIFPVEISSSLVTYHGEQVILSTVRDITERKHSEEELSKYREHLEILVKERTKELEEKNIELEKFNELFIGREFRIKELKEKVQELEEKLNLKK